MPTWQPFFEENATMSIMEFDGQDLVSAQTCAAWRIADSPSAIITFKYNVAYTLTAGYNVSNNSDIFTYLDDGATIMMYFEGSVSLATASTIFAISLFF